jgi:hypothetical protein
LIIIDFTPIATLENLPEAETEPVE